MNPVAANVRDNLTILYEQASACRQCPRLAARSAVLSRRNGRRGAPLLLIGEAPGRLGADRTNRPFVGDQSGRNLAALLDAAKVTRRDTFITNAVLCCPTNGQRNLRPTSAEVDNCGPFLRRTIALIQPRVVATLGAVALDAIQRVYAADQTRWRLGDVAGCPIQLEGFVLVPLYHPSPRVIHTRRNFDQQLADLMVAARLIRPKN